MVHEKPTLRATLQSIWSLTGPDEFEVVAPTEVGVAYGTRTGRGVKPLADVYMPISPSTSRPSVVLIHGGGFLVGHRKMKPMRMLAARLVGAGFAVCSLDYRMVFRGGRLAEATDDVVNGLSWWSGQAERYGLDLDRIAVLGLSAGGALSIIAGGHEDAPPIARTVSVFGLYDFTALTGGLIGRLPKLLTGSSDPEVWRVASPMNAVPSSSPVLMLHGSADAVVGIGQAEALAQVRRRAGLPTEFHRYEGAPHAFLNRPGPIADRALEHIFDFLRPLQAERRGVAA